MHLSPHVDEQDGDEGVALNAAGDAACGAVRPSGGHWSPTHQNPATDWRGFALRLFDEFIASGLGSACRARHHRRIVGCMRPELGRVLQ